MPNYGASAKRAAQRKETETKQNTLPSVRTDFLMHHRCDVVRYGGSGTETIVCEPFPLESRIRRSEGGDEPPRLLVAKRRSWSEARSPCQGGSVQTRDSASRIIQSLDLVVEKRTP